MYHKLDPRTAGALAGLVVLGDDDPAVPGRDAMLKLFDSRKC